MGPLTTKQRLQLFRITEDVQRSMCLDELAFITLMSSYHGHGAG